jgi:hypothetical protein
VNTSAVSTTLPPARPGNATTFRSHREGPGSSNCPAHETASGNPMTYNQVHCESCIYRHAAGTLNIQRIDGARHETLCLTCSQEAMS